ncbi:hypothetical protein P8C59_006841 [Phyllachora maydis]|uniref:JmjC domain-containing protein n=1 Tax=Phyllachora maydis TaxID=1825666 RepID=A0AAD9I7H8_9PEZI|nr:hypothetical protein P8C59_006841 [Phyllachora maydis]
MLGPERNSTSVNGSWPTPPVVISDMSFELRKHLPRIKERSMAEFQRLEDQAHMLASAPIIFTGLTGDWPALTNHPWSKPSYLLSHTFGGRRLVPVEVGRSYLDAGWGQKLVKFGDFMREYIEPGNQQHLALLTGDTSQAGGKAAKAPVGYLAQHQLFSQLPQLYKDVTIPDICFTSPSRHPIDPSKDLPQLDMPQLNAWFGPGGTITPLHTDPYHNLLVQVVGRKYVRLYAPCHSAKLRPMGKENGVDMSNTSSVDVGVMEGWDARPVADGGEGDEDWKFELRKAEFKSVPFVDCILEPGETLHIPVGWWHYVRSLSVSFSVSFWWN